MIEQGAVRVHLEGLRASLSRRAILLAGAINIKLPEGLTLTLTPTLPLTLHLTLALSLTLTLALTLTLTLTLTR